MKQGMCIARPSQLLKDHLLGVGEKTKNFAAKIGMSEQGELIGLLHDFGKYSQQFQNYIKSATGELHPDEDDEFVNHHALKGKIDHSTAGAQYLWQGFKSTKAGQVLSKILALCIASHHSGLIDCLNPDGVDCFDKRMDKENRKTNFAECCEKVDEEVKEKIDQLMNDSLLRGMAQRFSQITAENQRGQKLSMSTRAFNAGMLTRFLFSCLIDADRIDSADSENAEYAKERLKRKKYFDWEIATTRLEEKLKILPDGLAINKIRQKISNDCHRKSTKTQGIYTLTVPTGGGKTFSTLRYALHHAAHHQLDRIIYIVPYTSIIDQNAEAIRSMIEREGDTYEWVLEHHSNLEPEKQTWRSKITSENWDSPIVVTTMVRFLETLFDSGTRSARRLHQLANSVLIFDEIQTLPIKCVHLFCSSLNFLATHAKTTAILCTATQPCLDALKNSENGQLFLEDDHELIDNTTELFDELKRVDIVNKCTTEGWEEDEIVSLACDEYYTKTSCLVIVNTKSWATRLYKSLKDRIPSEAIFYLSTNQYPKHRKKVLAEIRERLDSNLPVLCVSTQLIEAGVDVDFSSVIRFLAGLDSIAQAAGRCNRNGRKETATVHVINPRDEKLGTLEEISIGQQKTRRILDECKEDTLLCPETVSRYFKYYFYDRADKMAYDLSPKQAGRNDTMLNLLSRNSSNVGNKHVENGMFSFIQQSFMTAANAFEVIDSSTESILIQHCEGSKIVADLCAASKDFNPRQYYHLLKIGQQYSVNVFQDDFIKLRNKGYLYEIQKDGIYYLDERCYSEEYGLTMEFSATLTPSII